MTHEPILIKDITGDHPDNKRFYWNQYSEQVATITAEKFDTVAYFAFPNHSEAFNFWKSVVGKHCTRAKVRHAERFTSHAYEVKCWDFNESVLESLIQRDRNRHRKPAPSILIPRDWEKVRSFDAVRAEAVAAQLKAPGDTTTWGYLGKELLFPRSCKS